jgi:hypothetical protein
VCGSCCCPHWPPLAHPSVFLHMPPAPWRRAWCLFCFKIVTQLLRAPPLGCCFTSSRSCVLCNACARGPPHVRVFSSCPPTRAACATRTVLRSVLMQRGAYNSLPLIAIPTFHVVPLRSEPHLAGSSVFNLCSLARPVVRESRFPFHFFHPRGPWTCLCGALCP